MNLTSLANVKQWVGVAANADTDNALLTRLMAEASRLILNYLNRADLGLTAVNEIISGRGERKIQLRNWPVLAVSGLTIEGVTIPPTNSNQTSWGYFLEPVYGSTAGRAQNVGIVYAGRSPLIGENPATGGVVAAMPVYNGVMGGGYGGSPFVRGVGNITVNYTYGYCIQNEAQTIPNSLYEVTPVAPYGAWALDNGVSYAGGAALTAIPSGVPTTGQYVPPNLAGDTPTLTYLFAAADAGKAILLNYNYVPYDVEQACIEVVGERYRYKARIGQQSQSLGGQTTTSYMVRDTLTPSIKGRLDPYRLIWGG